VVFRELKISAFYFIIPALLFFCLVFLYYRFDPAITSFFPQCPFHLLTDYDCPGCGSQRAIHSLLQGNIRQAADFNLLMVLFLPLLGINFCFKIYSVLSRKEVKWTAVNHPATPKIVFGLVIIFWIVRNIPVGPFSYFAS
jgi:hypothetical protein